jgi:hypothetical protein
MMEAVRTSETSVDNYFTWQYIPEDNSEQLKLHFLAVTVESNIQINFYLVHSFGCGGGCENGVVRNSVLVVVRWKQKQ